MMMNTVCSVNVNTFALVSATKGDVCVLPDVLIYAAPGTQLS